MKNKLLGKNLTIYIFLINLFSCHRDNDYRNQLRFKEQTEIVTKNIIKMDSLINLSPFRNNFQSCYIEHKSEDIVMYINDKQYIKQNYLSATNDTSYIGSTEFETQFLRTALVLNNNNISLILSPCGFLEFVFFYSNDRGLYRSIVVKKKEITTETFKICTLNVVDSSEYLWLVK